MQPNINDSSKSEKPLKTPELQKPKPSSQPEQQTAEMPLPPETLQQQLNLTLSPPIQKKIGLSDAQAKRQRNSEDPRYEQAHDLFLAHSTLADISRATGCTTDILKRWRKENDWFIEREDEDRGIIDSNFNARKVSIAKLLKMTSDELLRGVSAIASRSLPADLEEAVKLAAILGNLHKVAQLDNNKPTENLAIAGTFTVEDARKAILEDPFFEVEVKGL